jgi:hypothetical protein
MSHMPRTNFIQVQAGTAAQWTAANPVLALHEPGYEADTGKSKAGDGVTAWNDLDYNSAVLKSPDGTAHRLVVANDGTLSTVAV